MTNAESLSTVLEIRKERGLWADLRIVNKGEKPIFIHNPGSYQPSEGWEFSREAYNAAVLLSFGFLRMRLSKEDGAVIDPDPVATLGDHIAQLPLELEPGIEVRIISIPVHEFFALKGPLRYFMEVTYGDDSLKVSAQNRFQYP